MVRMERKFGNTDDGRGRFLRQIGALEFKNKERTNFRKKGRCCQLLPNLLPNVPNSLMCALMCWKPVHG